MLWSHLSQLICANRTLTWVLVLPLSLLTRAFEKLDELDWETCISVLCNSWEGADCTNTEWIIPVLHTRLDCRRKVLRVVNWSLYVELAARTTGMYATLCFVVLSHLNTLVQLISFWSERKCTCEKLHTASFPFKIKELQPKSLQFQWHPNPMWLLCKRLLEKELQFKGFQAKMLSQRCWMLG